MTYIVCDACISVHMWIFLCVWCVCVRVVCVSLYINNSTHTHTHKHTHTHTHTHTMARPQYGRRSKGDDRRHVSHSEVVACYRDQATGLREG